MLPNRQIIRDPRMLALLAALPGGGPPPIVATPGSPLPVAPTQVPIIAPIVAPSITDTADDFRNQDRLREAQQPEPPSAPSRADIAAAAEAKARENYAADLQTDITDSEKERFAAKRERYDTELSESELARKQQMWLALALAGAKMAQSQSPYFASALAEGMQSGIVGFDKARAEAAERKARLLDKQEGIDEAREAARLAAGRAAIGVRQAAQTAGRQAVSDVDAEAVAAERAARAAREAALAPLTARKAQAEATAAEVDAAHAETFARLTEDKQILAIQAAKVDIEKTKSDIANNLTGNGTKQLTPNVLLDFAKEYEAQARGYEKSAMDSVNDPVQAAYYFALADQMKASARDVAGRAGLVVPEFKRPPQVKEPEKPKKKGFFNRSSTPAKIPARPPGAVTEIPR